MNGTHTRLRGSLFAKCLLIGVAMVAGTSLNGPLCGQKLNRMVGIKAGAITTGVHSEVNAFLNTDWRSGLSAGAFVSIDPTSAFTLRADLLFSQKGFGFRMYDEAMGLIPGEVDVRSMEVQMDVGLRIPWPNHSASFRLFAGPAVGFELSCRVTGSVQGRKLEEGCGGPEMGVKSETNDLGFSLGGGMDLHFLPVTLVMDGRYTHGLLNLNKGSVGSESLTSRAWTFTVGLGWPFQGERP